MVFEKTDILLPKIKDYRKWAVVACDQFTSQPEYWENVQKYIGDEVSTYNLILPEASATFAHSGLAGSCRGRCPHRACSAPCQSVQGAS